MMPKSDNWMTPPDLIKVLDRRFNFTLEVCADYEHRALPHLEYMGLDNNNDALSHDWGCPGAVNYCNPPYSRLPDFVAAAEKYAWHGTNVLLIPAYTDTKYWHEHIDGKAMDVFFLKGRLRFWEKHPLGPKQGYPSFVPGKDSARFPSALVVFNRYGLEMKSTSYRCWDWRG